MIIDLYLHPLISSLWILHPTSLNLKTLKNNRTFHFLNKGGLAFAVPPLLYIAPMQNNLLENMIQLFVFVPSPQIIIQ